MKTIDSIVRMQTLSRILKKEGKSIGLVPTMGALHEGHLSLVKTARTHTDVVVMSIFVNPLQFGPSEDFDRYPRDVARDEELARAARVDVLFMPKQEEMYPDGYGTFVTVEGLTETLCGASRPGHFRGVTTVVAKLFNIVRPDMAYFGAKDAQQTIVIRRMVEDLNMGIDVKVLPTVREPDGLAMSSRNTYLTPDERRDAVIISQSLKRASEMVRQGERDAAAIKAEMVRLISAKPGMRIEYVSLVDTKHLKDVDRLKEETLIAVAVVAGKTRLIDNCIVKT